MEKLQCNEYPLGAAKGMDEDVLSVLSKRLEELKGYDNTERAVQDKLLPSINDDKCENVRTNVTGGNAKFPRSDARTNKPKSAAFSGAKSEKQHITGDLPWKWDLPSEIRSPPAERRTRHKTGKTNWIDANVTQETDEKMKELNAQISWIFEDSSDSDSELGKPNPQQESKEGRYGKKGPFDDKLRDHLMKELLKQGKDMKWFVAGAKNALDSLEKGHHKNDPGIKNAVRVSQELNIFLKKSMRPYYQEKKREKRIKKKLQKGQNQIIALRGQEQ